MIRFSRFKKMNYWCMTGITLFMMGLYSCSTGGVLDDGSSQDDDGGSNGNTFRYVSVPDEVAIGRPFYVETNEPASSVEIRVGDLILEPIASASVHGSLYRLPADHETGSFLVVASSIDNSDMVIAHRMAFVLPAFEDVSERLGLQNQHNVSGEAGCLPLSTGLAFGDVDNDGLPDVYLGNLGRSGRFFHNRGDQDGDGLPNFEEIVDVNLMPMIDRVSAVSFVDFDNDGDRDLFIGRWGNDMLLRNNLMESGTLSFTDVSDAMKIPRNDRRTMGAGWGDFDDDGDLDLLVTRHAWCGVDGASVQQEDQLLRNNGPDGFVDVSTWLENYASQSRSLGYAAVWLDFDLDGDEDLFVLNDYAGENYRPNQVWRNDGPTEDGGWYFADVSESSGLGPAQDFADVESALDTINAQGVSVGDLNRDGYPDLAFSNYGSNILMLNQGDGTFLNSAASAGVQRTLLPWGQPSITWATHFLDLNNDSFLDLFFSGGAIDDPEQPHPPAVFLNAGDNQQFEDITWHSGLAELDSGKGGALVDVDGDGWLDLAVANYNGPFRLWRNNWASRSEGHHWLAVELRGQGVPGKSNRDAIGSILTLTTGDGVVQTAFRTSQSGLAGGSTLTSYFGLGTQTAVTALRIVWPNGQVSQHQVSSVDQRLVLLEP